MLLFHSKLLKSFFFLSHYFEKADWIEKKKSLWPKIFKAKSYYMYYSTVCYHISTGLSPCTNRPINCKACNNCFWSYNIESHYKVDHLSLVVSSSLKTKLFLFCTCYLLKSVITFFFLNLLFRQDRVSNFGKKNEIGLMFWLFILPTPWTAHFFLTKHITVFSIDKKE